MTESQWLKSKDGDAMLALVEERLSARKWTLLACGVVRRTLDTLPNAAHHPLLDAVERGHWSSYHELVAEHMERAGADIMFAVGVAQARQRAALIGCDPDAAGQQFHDAENRQTNPPVPLFESASRNAALAVESIGAAAQTAARALWELAPSMQPDRLVSIRQRAVEAQVRSAEAGIRSALALELKARGDEMADRGRTRNAGVQLSEAIDASDRLEEQAGYRIDRLEQQKTRSENLAFARLLREQVGNPFRPYRFEAKWRTETAVALASAIEAERAFDRMPILADALMDADCDEEAILRHCRQAEPHARGCWVLDLILDREPELFAAGPLESRKRPQGRRQQLGRYTPPPEGMA